MSDYGHIPEKLEKTTRVFDTGATRDTDAGKLDFEGFISPKVWVEFAKYMHDCRLKNVPPGQTIRGSDNWQKGIPKSVYMKSMFRHFMDVWTYHRNESPLTPFGRQMLIRSLCALLFNVQGMMHELLKEEEEWEKKAQGITNQPYKTSYPIYP